MGWASGSSLFDAIIEAVMDEVPDKEKRKRIYKPIFDEFQAHDWDTEDECVGLDPAYDEMYNEYLKERGWYDETEDEDD